MAQGELIPWTRDTWQGVDFRALKNMRRCPNIRRGLWYPLTVISQYDHSPALRLLLQGFEQELSPYWAITEFYAKVFNPRTCLAWGLDVWGNIVGLSRTLKLKGLGQWFGFLGSGLLPMGQASFYDADATTAVTLDDTFFRRYIFFKAAINISNGTLADINRLTQQLFAGRGTVMVIHTGTMHLRFWFDFDLSEEERALILRDDIPPVPAGVGYDIMTLDPTSTFGFYGSELQPMNQGTFVPATGEPEHAYTV